MVWIKNKSILEIIYETAEITFSKVRPQLSFEGTNQKNVLNTELGPDSSCFCTSNIKFINSIPIVITHEYRGNKHIFIHGVHHTIDLVGHTEFFDEYD